MILTVVPIRSLSLLLSPPPAPLPLPGVAPPPPGAPPTPPPPGWAGLDNLGDIGANPVTPSWALFPYNSKFFRIYFLYLIVCISLIKYTLYIYINMYMYLLANTCIGK